ncbi:unnamed protein product [Heligmosomoides polygyrus]|uniref:BTB domain-containing protein n=1 Tax=Heligmosomoides polygyrus TaxID=6339 RepID=A0A3P8D1K1_HELPZ|nr:unnamed protein product [Heligmosomoides polygyrus]
MKKTFRSSPAETARRFHGAGRLQHVAKCHPQDVVRPEALLHILNVNISPETIVQIDNDIDRLPIDKSERTLFEYDIWYDSALQFPNLEFDVAQKGRVARVQKAMGYFSPDGEQRDETKGGTRGDKSAWFWNEEVQAAVKRKKEAYKLWQKTRAPEHLTAYRKLKRLAKTAVAKAENAEMDAPCKKLDGQEGEKFAIRLAKARHRACLDIRVVKTVKSADGRVLRKPDEVRERWEEYFKELLKEEFPRRQAEEKQPTEGPIPPWTQEESDYSDVTFMVEGERFHAHKMILAIHCEYFKAILYGGLKKSSEFEVKSKAVAFRAVLQYIYGVQIDLSIFHIGELISILRLVHRCELVEFQAGIIYYLKKILDVNTVFTIAETSALLSLDGLTEACHRFCDEHALEILKSKEFLTLPLTKVIEMLSRNSFYAPEIEIFHAVTDWIQAQPEMKPDQQLQFFKSLMSGNCLRLYLIGHMDLLNVVPKKAKTRKRSSDAASYVMVSRQFSSKDTSTAQLHHVNRKISPRSKLTNTEVLLMLWITTDLPIFFEFLFD